MQKKRMPPIIPIGYTAIFTFYILHTLKPECKSLLTFLLALLFCILLCKKGFACIVPYITPPAWYHAKKNKKILITHLVQRIPVIAIIAGALIGIYATLTVQKELATPHTLADIQNISAIIIELTGDPTPAGDDFFRVSAAIHACADNDGNIFSVKGSTTLLLPAALIHGTYPGSITRIGKTTTIQNTEWYHFFQTRGYHSKQKNICRFYSQGVRLFLHARANKDSTAFFSRKEHPLFLGWSSIIAHLRAILRFSVIRLLYEWGNAGGLLLALLAADKNLLPMQCINTFRYAGLAHILALSGMHVSLISTIALQSSVILRNKRSALLFSLIAAVIFVWFAGSAPSLNRALGMVLIAAAGQILGVRPSLLAVLCTMLTCHLIVYPADALRLGFILSYSACTGIILFGSAFNNVFKGKIPCRLLQAISTSAGAYLFTVPFIIYAIGFTASVGIIASCIITPLVLGFLIFGLLCIPFAVLFPVLHTLSGEIVQLFYEIIFSFSSFFARFPLIYPTSFMQKITVSIAFWGIGIVLITISHIQKKTLF